jgi:hypothetical protein
VLASGAGRRHRHQAGPRRTLASHPRQCWRSCRARWCSRPSSAATSWAERRSAEQLHGPLQNLNQFELLDWDVSRLRCLLTASCRCWPAGCSSTSVSACARPVRGSWLFRRQLLVHPAGGHRRRRGRENRRPSSDIIHSAGVGPNTPARHLRGSRSLPAAAAGSGGWWAAAGAPRRWGCLAPPPAGENHRRPARSALFGLVFAGASLAVVVQSTTISFDRYSLPVRGGPGLLHPAPATGPAGRRLGPAGVAADVRYGGGATGVFVAGMHATSAGTMPAGGWRTRPRASQRQPRRRYGMAAGCVRRPQQPGPQQAALAATIATSRPIRDLDCHDDSYRTA